MSEAFDIRNVLGKKPEEIKATPLIPSGMHKWLIMNHKFGKSSQKQTDFVGFELKWIEAGANVDPSNLEMWKQEMKEVGLSTDDVRRQKDCYITANPQTQVMFREFMEATGVNLSGRSLAESLPHTSGHQIWGEVLHEANPQRPGRFQERFGTFSKVDE